MGDNSIFIVFSNIWLSVHLKIPPQFQASWQQIVYIRYGQLKKKRLPFLFITLLLVFLHLIAANKSVLLLYACAHKISL